MATLTDVRKQQFLKPEDKPAETPAQKPNEQAQDGDKVVYRDLSGREVSYQRLMGQGWKRRHTRAERKAANAARMGEITAYRNRFLAAKAEGLSDDEANRIASGQPQEPTGPAPAPEAPIEPQVDPIESIKGDVEPDADIVVEVADAAPSTAATAAPTPRRRKAQ